MRFSVQAAEEMFYIWADDEGITINSQEIFDNLFDQYCKDNSDWLEIDWTTQGITYASDGSIIQ